MGGLEEVFRLMESANEELTVIYRPGALLVGEERPMLRGRDRRAG